jgi:hypothetical protein
MQFLQDQIVNSQTLTELQFFTGIKIANSPAPKTHNYFNPNTPKKTKIIMVNKTQYNSPYL